MVKKNGSGGAPYGRSRRNRNERREKSHLIGIDFEKLKVTEKEMKSEAKMRELYEKFCAVFRKEEQRKKQKPKEWRFLLFKERATEVRRLNQQYPYGPKHLSIYDDLSLVERMQILNGAGGKNNSYMRRLRKVERMRILNQQYPYGPKL